jgi:hypothetical protein
MLLRLKNNIKEIKIIESEEFNNDSEWIAGYFHNVKKIEDNNDFLDVYRYIQYFNLDITDEMLDYLKIPNYSIDSLRENMRLTGEDNYFNRLNDILNNPENVYTTKSTLLPNENEFDVIAQLALIDRADMTQYYCDNEESINDIYTNTKTGNAALEICRVLINNDYEPSDDIIYWYMTKGLGSIAKLCIYSKTDIELITNCYPVDLTSLKIIQEYKWSGNNIPFENAQDIFYNMLTSNLKIDCAMFIKLYKIIESEVTKHEKIMILNSLLLRKEEFVISLYIKELCNEDFDRGFIENQIFSVAKSSIGFQIYKLEIEKSNNYDVIYDYCLEMEDNFKIIDNVITNDAFSSDSSDTCSCSSSIFDGDDEHRTDTSTCCNGLNSFYDSYND